MGKAKKRLTMEALEKFDDGAKKAMRKIQKAQQKIETALTKVVSIIRVLLALAEDFGLASYEGGARKAKRSKKALASEHVSSTPTPINTMFRD